MFAQLQTRFDPQKLPPIRPMLVLVLLGGLLPNTAYDALKCDCRSRLTPKRTKSEHWRKNFRPYPFSACSTASMLALASPNSIRVFSL